jgi:uncharacterized protein
MEYKHDNPSDNRLVSADRQIAMMNPASTGVIHLPALMKYLRGHFRLDWQGIHGAPHWARVLVNGTTLAKFEGARLDVITLFSFLHDHERLDDNGDYDHGPRAAINAAKLRGTYFDIDDAGFDLLVQAMNGHSHGYVDGDITVKCCYDADRLDLGRVGVMPDPRYLCTDTAKNPEIIREAYERSIR